MTTIPTTADRVTSPEVDHYPTEDVKVGDRIKLRGEIYGVSYGSLGTVCIPSHLQDVGEITVQFDGVEGKKFVRTRNFAGNEMNEYEIVTNVTMPSDLLDEVEDDPVNPRHYASLGKYAAIYVIEKWGLGFNLGQVLKYIQRAGSKPGESELTDLEKAAWYLQRKLHELAPERHADPADPS